MLSLAPRVTWRRSSRRSPSGRRGSRTRAADGRPADRLRAAPRVSAGQRGDRQGAVRRRVRRRGAARAGLLRRAGAARWPAGGGARLCAPHHRVIRARRRREHRGQRRRLRLVDEGVRSAAGGRPRMGGTRATFSARRPRRHRGRRGTGRATRARHPLAAARRLPRRLSPRACAGRPAAAARSAALDSGHRDRAVRGAGDLLRQRRHLQPGRTGRGRASSATGKSRTSTPCVPTSSPPPIPDARCRWPRRRGAPAARGRFVIRSKSWTRRSPAGPFRLFASERQCM